MRLVLRTGLAFAKREIAKSRGHARQCHSNALKGLAQFTVGMSVQMRVASFYAYVGMKISSRRRKRSLISLLLATRM
jgi:hypothetical protein